MESAADKLSILQENVNAFFIRFFDGMYPDREDRDPDLVKLKRIGSLNQFNGVDKDYSDIDIKMDITKAFTYIVNTVMELMNSRKIKISHLKTVLKE